MSNRSIKVITKSILIEKELADPRLLMKELERLCRRMDSDCEKGTVRASIEGDLLVLKGAELDVGLKEALIGKTCKVSSSSLAEAATSNNIVYITDYYDGYPEPRHVSSFFYEDGTGSPWKFAVEFKQ